MTSQTIRSLPIQPKQQESVRSVDKRTTAARLYRASLSLGGAFNLSALLEGPCSKSTGGGQIPSHVKKIPPHSLPSASTNSHAEADGTETGQMDRAT